MSNRTNKNNKSSGVIAKTPEFNKDVEKDQVLVIREINKNIKYEWRNKWYAQEYRKQLQYKPMPNIAKAKDDIYSGSMRRMLKITQLKYVYNYNTMDMIVIVMKLYDYNLKKSVNYGTLFVEIVDNMTKMQVDLSDRDIFGKCAFTYFSASPSHISCDGEYRSTFSKYYSITRVKATYPDIWNELEEFVTHIRTRRNWSLYTSYFYPKMEQEERNNDVEYAVKNELVTMNLLIVCWFITIFNAMLDITENHINPVFREIMLSHKDNDIKFLEALIKKYGSDRVEAFKEELLYVPISAQGINNINVVCGYKMIPLNIKEVQDPINMRYKPWREYYASMKCNNLVINSISPSFPIILDWFYIKNSRKGLYDNKSQYDRLKNSELAKDILHILYEAQRSTYFATESTSMLKTTDQQKNWISTKFKKLSAKIDEPINYSVEEIIMSEVTLAFANEHIGRTVADTMLLTVVSKPYSHMLGHPFKDVGYDYFAKYIFEICYGLLCANRHLGIIHGDFHLNNATIGRLYYPGKEAAENKNKENRVVYVIDDEFQFMFPTNGFFGSIIDLSRCVINPNKIELFKDSSLPATQKIIKDEKQFRNTEMHVLLHLYLQMFPSKLRQKEELIVLFKNHFDEVFKLLTCIDIYMFSIRLSRVLNQTKYPIYKRVIELVDKINRLAEGYIATDMNHLMNEPASYATKVSESEWPILTILKKCFHEYIDGKAFKTPGTIVDTYIYNNEMKHSLDRYENFPDLLKYTKYIDPKKGTVVDIPAINDVRKKTRLEYEKIKQHNLDMVSYIATRHAQKTV